MSIESSRDRLETLAARDAGASIAGQFASDPRRLERLTLEAAGIFLDLSKQTWSAEGLAAALDLARSAEVERRRGQLFAGEAVNASEGRAALHMALRAPDGGAFSALGQAVSAEVEATRRAMADFAEAVRASVRTGATGRPFSAVLHIGIGGSDLGPRMVWEALKPLDPAVELRFVANIDGGDLAAALNGLDPETTLVIVVSKTFTTQETLANATAARAWLAGAVGEAGLKSHLVGVSAAPERARAFGCGEVFGFADWVGGRYSLWSAVGLSCAIGLGWEVFAELLAGGAAMDDHFRAAPLEANAPVLLALAQVFNVAAGRHARTVAPYAHRLRLLPAFLQQLEMESNGKRIGPDGRPTPGSTCPVVFGEPGTNGQHAYFQLLHQGTEVIPAEFVVVRDNPEGGSAQAALNANAVAQAEALMRGRDEAEVRAELEGQGLAPDEVARLAPQKAFPGGRPSTTLVLDRLDPHALGALVALYEHKTFVEGVVWGVNSFDQWGVELGKVLARQVLAELEGGAASLHDPSTSNLISRLRG